jgi:hypothetical protein
MRNSWEESTHGWPSFDLNEVPQDELSPENPGYFDSQASSSAAREPELNPNLHISKPSLKDFKLNDWSFLREFPEDRETAESQNDFLKLLQKCNPGAEAYAGSSFFIPRNQANQILGNVKGLRVDPGFMVPQGKSSDQRYYRYHHILLRISDKKIDLGSNKIFSEEIVSAMMERVQKNSRGDATRPRGRGSEFKMENVQSTIEDVTKVTHLMIILVLSLYKQHGQETLQVDAINKHLKFIKELWFRLEEDRFVPGENVWEQNIHDMLKFPLSTLASQPIRRYGHCRNFLRYWIEKNNMQVRREDGKIVHRDTVIELMNKLIYFSNIKTMQKEST